MSKLINFVKVIGFSFVFFILVQIIFAFLPFTLLFDLNNILTTATSPFAFANAPAIDKLIAIASVLFIFLLFFVYAIWVSQRFFVSSQRIITISILVMLLALLLLSPLTLLRTYLNPLQTSTSDNQENLNKVEIINQEYYLNGETLPDKKVHISTWYYDSTWSEELLGIIKLDIRFVNPTNRSLNLLEIEPQEHMNNSYIDCMPTENDEVAANQILELTLWCALVDPLWYSDVSTDASEQTFIINGKPLELQLDFSTNADYEEIRRGEASYNEIYPFVTDPENWQ